MSAPVLIHWGARKLTPCLHHLDTAGAGVDVLEVRGHNEAELAAVLASELLAVSPDTPVMIAPDDLVVSTQAIDVLLERYATAPGVWCGWSNVDFTHPVSNVMLRAPHKPEPSSASDYDLMPIAHIATRTEPFRVGFNGFTLLTMPAHLWLADATRLAPCGGSPGYASDWALCYRLAQQDVPIMCEPAAFAAHIKVDYQRADTQDEWKRIDLATKSVRWT